MIMHGVEQNPGPRSRGGNPRGASGRGQARGQGRQSTVTQIDTDIFSQSSNAPQTRSSRLLSEQSTMSTWLRSSQSSLGTNSQNSNRSNRTSECDNTQSILSSNDSEYDDAESEIDNDITVMPNRRENVSMPNQHESLSMSILIDIQKNCQDLNKKFDKMDKSVNQLKKANKKLQDQNLKLTKTVDKLASTVSELESSAEVNSSKLDQLEGQSRRQNLKFYEIEESNNETWEASEEKVRTYIRTELDIDDSNISIERAHRLPGKNKPRPIIVKFSFYKDKDRVIKRYRELRKSAREASSDDNVSNVASGGSSDRVRVSEDFPDRVRKVRSALIPFLRQSIQSGRNAYQRHDKLVVNGNAYVFDETRGRPIPAFK